SVWLRLRYSLTPSRENVRAFSPQSGVLALPQVAQHAFELKLSYVGLPHPGKPFVVHAQAVHPKTRAPALGLDWKATLKLDRAAFTPVSISSQSEGLTDIVFNIPEGGADQENDEANLVVDACLGDFCSQVHARVPIQSRISARIQTDKPIYQPGQTLHLRAVVLNPQGAALDQAQVVLRIDDEDGNRIHTAHLETSKFGVIHDDWTLPPSAALGEYQIALNTEEDEDFALARHIVRVSRYELPVFNVAAKPDRP